MWYRTSESQKTGIDFPTSREPRTPDIPHIRGLHGSRNSCLSLGPTSVQTHKMSHLTLNVAPGCDPQNPSSSLKLPPSRFSLNAVPLLLTEMRLIHSAFHLLSSLSVTVTDDKHGSFSISFVVLGR